MRDPSRVLEMEMSNLSGGYMSINICQNPLSNKFRICSFYGMYVVPQEINNKQTTGIENSLCQGQVKGPDIKDAQHG